MAISTVLTGKTGTGSGVGGTDIMSADTADSAVLTGYTQTGLEIVSSPVIHGAQSFRLQHTSSVKSFKKIIAVDKKFRGKNITLYLDVLSSATSGNLNLLVTDETNSVTLAASQPIATNSQSITATINATTSMTVDSTTFNLLKVGMIVSSSVIPVGTVITALNVSTLTATLSQSATGSASSVRISDIVNKKTFSFDMPTNCSSVSWTISTLVEANTESYVDDIVLQLTSLATMSASITVPIVGAAQAWTPTFSAGFGTVTSVQAFYEQVGDRYECWGSFTTGTVTSSVAQITTPFNMNTAYLDTTATLIGSVNTTGSAVNGQIEAAQLTVLAQSANTISCTNVVNGTTIYNNTANPANTFFNSTTRYSFKFSVAVVVNSSTTSTSFSLASAQLVQTPDSQMTWQGYAGLGSTRTRIPYFTNARNMVGSAIKFTSDSVNGLEVTVLEDGYYTINFNTLSIVSSSFPVGLGVNLTDFTTTVSTRQTDPTVVKSAYGNSTTSTRDAGELSWSGPLKAGDKVYPMMDTGSTDLAQMNYFSISKAGSLKQLNPSSDSKISIPTHSLRFEGAAARGSVDTATVMFTSQVKTQGDAWSVSNTSTNGTIITMQKAGKLQVDVALYSPQNNYAITVNEVNLTTLTKTSGITIAYKNETGNLYSDLTATVDVKIGDKIRIMSGSTPSDTSAFNSLNLSLMETSIAANFSNILPQWSQSDSCIQLNTFVAYGSTNTAIVRFANQVQSIGGDITYVDSVALGASFTINTSGTYNIAFNHAFSISGQTVGLSKNTTTPNTSMSSIAVSEKLAVSSNASANQPGFVSWQGYLNAGDVIRPHVDIATAGATPDRSEFTISKIGKPNLTSVDVTPFVNMKTTDTQYIKLINGTTGNPTTNFTVSQNTNTGILSAYNTTTGYFTALKKCIVAATVTGNGTGVNVGANIYVNGSVVASQTNASAGQGEHATITVELSIGDTIGLGDSGLNNRAGFISAWADNGATASPTQQVSSDTMNFAFKSTAVTTSDPIGTFNTYSKTINTSNTYTINTTAPTQTTSSMNANGIQVFGAAYNAASTAAQPSRFDIFIGTGLKSNSVLGYGGLAKTLAFDFGLIFNGASASTWGTLAIYNEVTGILSIDAGSNISTGTTAHSVDSGTSYTSGYFVINASKSPSLVTIPNTLPRVAYLSEQQVSGTGSGSSVATTWTNRVLNTIVDSTGIVTSLASNQFVLPAGTYRLSGNSSFHGVSGIKIRLRNITDSTTAINSTPGYAPTGTSNVVSLDGEFTITSAKTMAIQYWVTTGSVVNGLGIPLTTGENELYTQIAIQKIK